MIAPLIVFEIHAKLQENQNLLKATVPASPDWLPIKLTPRLPLSLWSVTEYCSPGAISGVARICELFEFVLLERVVSV